MATGPFTKLPPISWLDVINQTPAFQLWLERVQLILSGIPGIEWEVVSKTGSNLTDIESRDHNDLQTLDAADAHPWDSITKTGSELQDVETRPHSQLQSVLGGADQHHVQETERAELTALDSLGNGLVTKTADATYAGRTITGTSDEVDVTDGDGVSGNPTIALPTLISGPRQFGGASNYSEFEADGTLEFNGDATVWVDIDFPIITRTAVAGQPTPSTLIGNLVAPQWSVGDYFDCQGQEFIHPWKEGSQVNWHIHMYIVPDSTDSYVNWQIEYTWANSSQTGVVVPATTTVSSGDFLIPGDGGTGSLLLFIIPVSSFTPTGGQIAAHAKARLTRIASTGTAPTNDPFCEMLQLHVECDTVGSRQMVTK